MKFLTLMYAILILMLYFTTSESSNETYNLINSTNLVKQGCESRCGDLIVPYPFGIIGKNPNCSIGTGFDIYCNTSSNPPKATIGKKSDGRIKRISDSSVRTSNVLAMKCYYPNGTVSVGRRIWATYNYTDSPYTLSELNKFIVIGCDDYAWLKSRTMTKNVDTGCMVFCSKPDDVLAGECSGNGCCQSSIPQDINYFQSRLRSMADENDESDLRSFNPCTYGFVGDANEFKFNGPYDLNDTSFVERTEANVSMVLEWAIGNLSCVEAQQLHGYACQSNSTCVSSTRKSGGYRCVCNQGYQGNPYLSPGCQDIDECADSKTFPCYRGTCINTPGNYTCKCKGGYSGDGKTQDGCRRKPFNVIRFSLGTGLGLLTLLIGLLALYFMEKQRRQFKLREKFFKQNGGTLLEDKLKATGRVGVSSMKIFRVEELKEATNNYAEDRILGKGGNGIVYKGILPADKRVVAIKKSQKVDQEQREQFINEMEILTQINHHNVVQLLGCCLETDVPLLVYEFVSNDTLDRHIHSRKGLLSWDSRLRIAHESASALAYIHTDTRMSIIHRDVKSANILLDENFTAKIADFGASRLVPLGHDEVITLVQGTVGYLDPEYFHTGQLTDKSDVYSFGVVLAELITGKRARVEDTPLATYFIKAEKENRVSEIVERLVANEASDEQLKAACELVCRCLDQVAGNRPSMKQVAMELETLRKMVSTHDNDKERSRFMNETGEFDLYPSSDTFGGYGSGSTALMKEIMLEVQHPR